MAYDWLGLLNNSALTDPLARQTLYQGSTANFNQGQQGLAQKMYEPVFGKYLAGIGQQIMGGQDPQNTDWASFLNNYDWQREFNKNQSSLFDTSRLFGRGGFVR